MKGDIWSESMPEGMDLVSNVVSLNAVNPNTDGNFELIDDSSFDASVIVYLSNSNSSNNVVVSSFLSVLSE